MPRFPLTCSSEEDCPMVHGGNSDRKANKLPLFTWIKKRHELDRPVGGVLRHLSNNLSYSSKWSKYSS